MKLRTKVMVIGFALALAGQVPILPAQSMAEPSEPSTVDVMANGFFAQPSMDASLEVMNVRVFNDANELVLYERSLSHSVQLLAAGLPDGRYFYEVVSIFKLAEPVGEGADYEEHSSQRNFGTFEVKAGAIEVPHVGEFHDPGDDGFSMLGRMSDRTLAAIGHALSLLVPAAHAADVTISDFDPDLFFQDTDGGSNAFGEWTIQGTQTEFQIRDQENNFMHPIIEIIPGTGHADSLLIDADGDLHWANGGMNFDRSQQALRIGGNSALPENLIIYDTVPDIRLHDTNNTAEAEWQLNGNLVTFWGRPHDGASWDDVISYNVNSPSDSLVIDTNGQVGMGVAAPARQLHMSSSNAVFRMDRSSNSAAFMLVRTTGGGTPEKTFVVGVNAFGSDNGEFVINDLHTAVAGGGSRRMTINNSGNVNFPGVVTASNIVAPSSRSLKKNIAQITDPLELTQRLEGVRFDWRRNDEPALGFIAEDIEQVLPEVVLHDEGTDEMLGVNYAAVVPVLVEAIKAQQLVIEALEEKTSAMEQQQQEIDALKAQLAALQDQESRLARLEALVVGKSLEAKLAHN